MTHATPLSNSLIDIHLLNHFTVIFNFNLVGTNDRHTLCYLLLSSSPLNRQVVGHLSAYTYGAGVVFCNVNVMRINVTSVDSTFPKLSTENDREI